MDVSWALELWDVRGYRETLRNIVSWSMEHHAYLAYAALMAFMSSSWYISRRRWKKELLKAKKNAASYHKDILGSNLYQALQTDWLNLMVHSTWNQFLEKEVSYRLAKQLQESVDKSVKGGGTKRKGFGRFVRDFKVEEFSLGCVPPICGPAIVQRNTDTNQLEFRFDVSFTSVGMKAIINVMFRPHSMIGTIQGLMEIPSLTLDGRVILSLQLCEEHPGIASYSFSFESEPELQIVSRPSGSKLLEIPGVGNILSDLIKNFVNSRFVLPKCVVVDLKRKAMKRSYQLATGSGGVLQVVVQGITNLQKAHKSHGLVCRLRFQKEVKYSRLIKVCRIPIWGDTFYFPLPRNFESRETRSLTLSIACYEVSEANILRFGGGKIDVQELVLSGTLQKNGQAQDLPIDVNEHGAILSTSLQWLPSQATHLPRKSVEHIPSVQAIAATNLGQSGGDAMMSPGTLSGRLTTNGAQLSTKDALYFMFQVLKLEGMVQAEAEARVAAEAKLASVTKQVKNIMEHDLAEQLRSLLEGGDFLMALNPTKAVVQRVWFDAKAGAICWDRSRGGHTTASVHYKKMVSVVNGMGAFGDRQLKPHRGEGKLHSFRHYRRGFPTEMLAFSILLEGQRALHLHIPSLGNGRSRREWVTAFGNLCLGKFSMDQ